MGGHCISLRLLWLSTALGPVLRLQTIVLGGRWPPTNSEQTVLDHRRMLSDLRHGRCLLGHGGMLRPKLTLLSELGSGEGGEVGSRRPAATPVAMVSHGLGRMIDGAAAVDQHVPQPPERIAW